MTLSEFDLTQRERCTCGHARRDHHRWAMLPDTPPCRGTLDYGEDCTCTRYRAALESTSPAVDPLAGLDAKTAPERTAPERRTIAVAVRVCPNCGHDLIDHVLRSGWCFHTDDDGDLCPCASTKANVPPYVPQPEYTVYREVPYPAGDPELAARRRAAVLHPIVREARG